MPFQRVWALAEAGLIHAVKPKGRILYLEAELRAVLDREGWEPPPPADLDRARRVKEGKSPKGGQLSFIELEAAA